MHRNFFEMPFAFVAITVLKQQAASFGRIVNFLVFAAGMAINARTRLGRIRKIGHFVAHQLDWLRSTTRISLILNEFRSPP